MADLSVPEPGPHDVLVQVKHCGVCGSDSHCMETDGEDYLIFSGPARLPVVPGHEYSGVVVSMGSAVSTVRVGELVTAEGMLLLRVVLDMSAWCPQSVSKPSDDWVYPGRGLRGVHLRARAAPVESGWGGRAFGLG